MQNLLRSSFPRPPSPTTGGAACVLSLWPLRACRPFTGTYRNDIVDAWLKELKNLEIPCGDTFDLREVMGNPVEIREWNLQGLPADVGD